MIIKEYLKKSAKILKNKNISQAFLEAEILLCFILKKEKNWLYANFDYKLKPTQIKKGNNLIKKRIQYIPISQIIKQKEFYKLNFFINKNVLTPRPETEIIINKVLEILKTKKYQTNADIIDIGIGSGAIIITLAKIISQKNINFLGIEISNKAIYVARKNSQKHKVNKKIKIIKGNLLKPFFKKPQCFQNPTIITANLPYLTPQQFKTEKSIQKEPQIALISGKDGLKDYRRLFQQLNQLVTEKPLTIIIEFNPTQINKLKKIITTNLSQVKIEIKKDFCGLERIIIVSLN